MEFFQELEILFKARFSLIFISTSEELRVLEQVKKLCDSRGRALISWDVADGFYCHTDGVENMPPAPSPIAALDQMEKMQCDAIFLLKDFDETWSNTQVKRKLKNVAQRFRKTRKSIVVLGCTPKVPEQLKDDTYAIEFPLPALDDMVQVLKKVSEIPAVRINLSELGREKLLRAALGLSSSQCLRLLSKAIVTDGVLDDRHIEMMTEEKKQVIKESQALEFFGVSETVDDIGGLDVLKEWLRLRERAFSEEAERYMLPAPKGIILLGIPGTGKSLTAKTIGSSWRMPVLRLDIGSLFGSLVGESEERTRKALHVAGAISPCVLWIDELEKAFAAGDIDGGVSKRVFSTILTWMQEKKKPCFVVATANDTRSLPPELLRRGRFDEVFFLDLPTIQERQEIFSVHIKKRKRLVRDFDIDKLAQASQGYVGAEIEQSIIDAMYIGFDQGREFVTDDILAALSRQIPLSVSQSETVDQLRSLLIDGKVQSASFREAREARESFVQLKVVR